MLKKNKQNNINLEQQEVEKGGINNTLPKKKGKGLKIFLIILLVIIFLFVGAGVMVRLLSNDVEPVVIQPENPVEQPEQPEQETETPTEPVIEEQPVENIDTEEPTIEEQIAETYDYDNKLVGIKFNYATDMYIKENTESIFNTLKEISGEDLKFNIEEDKIINTLPLLTLTTGNSDGLRIKVSIISFSLVQGNKELSQTYEYTIPEINDALLKTYDKQIKESLISDGSTIYVFEDSYIKEVNDNRVIISERKYSSKDNVETKTGVVDVMQGIIPVGVNAVLVTALTDGNPIDIDKVELFNEIIDSLVVETKAIVEEKPSTVNAENTVEPVTESAE